MDLKLTDMFLVLMVVMACAVDGIRVDDNATAAYDPVDLLSKIFSRNQSSELRQFNQDGQIRFEGQLHSVGQDDHRQSGSIVFDGQDSGHTLKFEDQGVHTPNFYAENDDNYDIRLEQANQPFKFEEQGNEPDVYPENEGIRDDIKGQGVAFQDDNRIEEQTAQNNKTQGLGQKKRKRRRRRRPRFQQQGYGYLGPRPGLAGPGSQGHNPYENPGYGQFYRPPRLPRPSRAADALSAVTGALTSIALYDDYQCVPRLLCEAAGGGALGSAGSAGWLQTVAGLQPLLTLLAAYNGVSTSPLFLFGRAVFLGMTSKATPGTCRYAYPLCPTDPEQLVHYLNNHNGGFFRFFSSPQLSNPQYGLLNVEQFYNQLSVPNQSYQPNTGQNQPNTDQQYPIPGLQNTGPQYPVPGQQYPVTGQQYPIPSQQYPGPGQQSPGQLPVPHQIPGQYYLTPGQQTTGSQHPPPGPQYPAPGPQYPAPGSQYPTPGSQYPAPGSQYPGYGLYNNLANSQISNYGYGFQGAANNGYQQNYGPNYVYGQNNKYGFHRSGFKNNKDKAKEEENNKIEKRIQNIKSDDYTANSFESVEQYSKWSFPDGAHVSTHAQYNKHRDGKELKFPKAYTKTEVDVKSETNRNAKGFYFPGIQTNRQYAEFSNYDPPTDVYNNKDFIHNEEYGIVDSKIDSYQNKNNFNQQEDGVEIVYVVRGNGDPRNPEIIKLKPGEKIM